MEDFDDPGSTGKRSDVGDIVVDASTAILVAACWLAGADDMAFREHNRRGRRLLYRAGRLWFATVKTDVEVANAPAQTSCRYAVRGNSKR